MSGVDKRFKIAALVGLLLVVLYLIVLPYRNCSVKEQNNTSIAMLIDSEEFMFYCIRRDKR